MPSSDARPSSGRLRTVLATVFFLSGMSSLVYQVVWQRLLTLHYGVGSVSNALIVSVYMFGLGLGALVGGSIADRLQRRIGLYVVVETLLAGFGVLSLPFSMWLGSATAGSSHAVSLLCMFVFLACPTILMGTTLPLLVKIFADIADGFFDNVSLLYFVNTLGAAFGALVASYGLISFLGLDGALYVAAGVNATLALTIAGSARRSPTRRAGRPTPHPSCPSRPGLGRWAYVAVFVTGYLAIGYEIVWFRIIGVLNKASAYSFSGILAVYLLGIALGSMAMRTWIRRHPGSDRASLFFLMQFAVAVTVLLSMVGFVSLTEHTAFEHLVRMSFEIPQHPSLETAQGTLTMALAATDVFLWPLFLVLVPTLFMGAGFPLIADLARTGRDTDGRTVGRVYFFSTMGNLAGGLLTGFVLMPALGTERTLVLFTLVGASYLLWARRLGDRPVVPIVRWAVVATVAAAALLALPERTGLWRTIHPPAGDAEQYIDEGVNGVVVTYIDRERVDTYIDGVAHGGRPRPDLKAEIAEMAALTPRIETVLMIGYGTGSTAEAVARLSGVKKITVVEINPVLVRNLQRVPLFRALLADPLIEVVIDDGRRYLQRDKRRYDMILMDPLHHYTAYSNNLYSTEFFQLVADHLKPDGTFRIWVDEYKVLPKTVATVFPHVRQYRRHIGYGDFIVASNQLLGHDPQRFASSMVRVLDFEPPAFPVPPWSLRGDRDYVLIQAAGYPPNRDLRPVCEYFVGLEIRERLGNPMVLRLVDDWDAWIYALADAPVAATH